MMSQIHKIILIIVLSVILLITVGCSLRTDYGPDIEIVVDNVFVIWFLSPQGDKIIYKQEEDNQTIILFLETGDTLLFNDCFPYWLDNNHFKCQEGEVYTIQVNPYHTIQVAIEERLALEVNLDELFSTFSQVYALVDTDQLWFVQEGNTPHLINDVENIENIVKTYPQTQIIETNNAGGFNKEKVLSPDQRYYYNSSQFLLTIHHRANDEIVTEAVTDKDDGERIVYTGWAADSSGVYFSGQYSGMFNPSNTTVQILKLNIPSELTGD